LRSVTGSITVKVTLPEGLCTTLESMACSPTSMNSSKICEKPKTRW
jgi:hypothetical protein